MRRWLELVGAWSLLGMIAILAIVLVAWAIRTAPETRYTELGVVPAHGGRDVNVTNREDGPREWNLVVSSRRGRLARTLPVSLLPGESMAFGPERLARVRGIRLTAGEGAYRRLRHPR